MYTAQELAKMTDVQLLALTRAAELALAQLVEDWRDAESFVFRLKTEIRSRNPEHLPLRTPSTEQSNV